MKVTPKMQIAEAMANSTLLASTLLDSPMPKLKVSRKSFDEIRQRQVGRFQSAGPDVLVIAGFLGLASPAQAQDYSTCDQWGEYTQGEWTIYNNVWGTSEQNTQCLHVNSIKPWYVDSTQSGGGVKSYPNTTVRPHTPLAQVQSATFTYNTSSAPATSDDWWNWTSDIWSTGGADEVMIFTSWHPQGGGWGTQIRTNVTIGGILYAEVWQADPG